MKPQKQLNEIVKSIDIIVDQTKDNGVPKWEQILSVILAACAVIYDVSPVDLIPAFPIDNLLATGAAIFNLIQQNTQNQQALLAKISKILKWCFILLLILVVLVFGSFFALVLNLFL